MYGDLGLIPAPSDTLESFLYRTRLCINNACKMLNEHISYLDGEEFVYSSYYGMDLSWLPCIYSNRKLSLWEGGALWVSKECIPLVQLRRCLKTRALLGCVKDEVLHHEIVHALRVGFNEPRFEEILAYSCSSKRWRRFFGPLFRSPRDVKYLLIAILGALLAGIVGMLLPLYISIWHLYIIICAPIGFLCLKCISLIQDQKTFKKSRNVFRQYFNNIDISHSLLVRLTDREIQQFSSMPINDIIAYFHKNKRLSLRKQQIWEQFFSNLSS